MPITLPTTIKVIRYISIGLFLICLVCPCYDTEKEVAGFGQGAWLLLTGLLWFMYVSPGFVWLANPLILFSWICAGRNRDKSFLLSMLAILIALCFLFYKDILTDESGSNTTPIVAHRIGYWFWLASMLTIILGNLYVQLFSKGSVKIKSPLVEEH